MERRTALLLMLVIVAPLATAWADVPTFTAEVWGDTITLCDLNNLGQLVGFNSLWAYGFILTPNGGSFQEIQLGSDYPRAISDNGFVVVEAALPEDFWGHGFIIVPEDTNADGTPDLWYRDNNSDGVNDLRHDLGHAFLITPNGIDWEHPPTYVTDVNNDGVVVGFASDYPSWEVGFLSRGFVVYPEDTNADGKPDTWFRDDNADGFNDLMYILPGVGSAGTSGSDPRQISEDGIIVGEAWVQPSSYILYPMYPARWADPSEFEDLGLLYGGYSEQAVYPGAYGINELGQIVGMSSVPHGGGYWEHACLWDAGQAPVDLGVLDVYNPYGWSWIFSRANDINDRGWIVGRGTFYELDGLTQNYGFLLIPADSDGDGRPDQWYHNDESEPPLTGTNDLMINLADGVPGAPSVYLRTAGRVNRRGQILGSTATGDCLLTPTPPINAAPYRPAVPTGAVQGIVGRAYSYETTGEDFEQDNIYYQWDYDDAAPGAWVGPYASGATAGVSHAWAAPGQYDLRVRAKDTADATSNWSAGLSVHIVHLGDMNLDGAVNFGDINAFVTALIHPDEYIAQYNFDPAVVGDINQDDVFDFADINAFVDMLT